MAHTAPQSVILAPGYSGSKSSGFSSVEGSRGGEEPKPESEPGEPWPTGEGGEEPKPESEPGRA